MMEPESPYLAESKADSGLYRSVLSMALHQDRLLWSRVQLLIAVQGAVLAGSYALRASWLAPAILGFGAALTLLLISLVEKDQLDRDVNQKLLDELGSRCLPEDLRNPGIRFTAKIPKGSLILRGRHVLRLVLWGFFVLDLVLGVLHATHAELFPAAG
jgi:hypothetical protein